MKHVTRLFVEIVTDHVGWPDVRDIEVKNAVKKVLRDLQTKDSRILETEAVYMPRLVSKVE